MYFQLAYIGYWSYTSKGLTLPCEATSKVKAASLNNVSCSQHGMVTAGFTSGRRYTALKNI